MKKGHLILSLFLVGCSSGVKSPIIEDPSTDVYTTLTGTATASGSSVKLNGDILSEQIITTTPYKVITNDGGIKEVENEKGSYAVLDVSPNERYAISTSGKELGISLVLFAKDDKVVEEKLAKSELFNSFQIVVPEGANKLYINCNNTKAIKVQKITKGEVSINENAILPSTLTVGTTNCGTFTVKSETTTTEEYKSEWEKLFSEHPANLYGFQEYKDKFSSSIQAKDVVGKSNYFTQVTGLANNLAVSTSVTPETVTLVPVDFTFDGTTKTTAKFFALRSTFHIGTKEVAYYNVHFCAENHLSSDIYKDNMSYSAYLRKIQYQEIIQDASYYDEAIFAGDFNAQTISEYDVFTSANCSLSNGGEFGTYQTHGEATTDNIIVTSGLKINSASAYTNYTLNTDHDPIISSISLK